MPATQPPVVRMQDASPASIVRRRYLYGPALDFLLLGGGSVFALLLLWLYLRGVEDSRALSIGATLALANIINHPHFAHSYQIFYQNFPKKIRSEDYPRDLRQRYFLVGLVVPALIITFLTWAVIEKEPRILGIATNVMFFLVGWHYVKQGYGMAMVDAALKRKFYADIEKKSLLVNSYAVWIFSWLLANHLISDAKGSYFGIEYFAIPIRTELLWLAGISTLASTTWSTYLLWRRVYLKKELAWNGLIAYGVSLYIWLLIRDPIVLLWVPAFHSLQYLAVVWRFQSNQIQNNLRLQKNPQVGWRVRMSLFLTIGLAFGYLGFWLLPEWLNSKVPYDKETFGPALFFFIFWIFINIHHYFIDTVMWRKGNPDVSRHLFGSGN